MKKEEEQDQEEEEGREVYLLPFLGEEVTSFIVGIENE